MRGRTACAERNRRRSDAVVTQPVASRADPPRQWPKRLLDHDLPGGGFPAIRADVRPHEIAGRTAKLQLVGMRCEAILSPPLETGSVHGTSRAHEDGTLNWKRASSIVGFARGSSVIVRRE